MSSKPKASKPRAVPVYTRSVSASEISRNLGHFETWSTYQGCEQVSSTDIPEEFSEELNCIFDVAPRLPSSWLKESFKCTPDFSVFIRSAFKECPSMFSDNIEICESIELFEDITIVFSAWKRLCRMLRSEERWSEADFEANVYNTFRSPAVRDSTYRVQCTVSLPQPIIPLQADTDVSVPRILNTKTVVPDCAIFVPVSITRSLSHSAKSPYKVLKSHPLVAKAGGTTKGSSFSYQSTPCAQLPDFPRFEFISSVWEDKKPIHTLLDDAYRQNRMATASVVRHLHSLNIQAPIIGLVWANGTVRAHVDWCKEETEGRPVIYSAPYSGAKNSNRNETFHEWVLNRPSDILWVYIMIRNIDMWTVGRFHERIVKGCHQLVKDITVNGQKYSPWKRVGSLVPALTIKAAKENISTTTTTTTSSSPPRKVKSKRRKRRSSH